MKNIRRYSELIMLPTYEERFQYLKIADGRVGQVTFGFDRWLNQHFYNLDEYKAIRRQVIARDNGHEMGLSGDEFEIAGNIILHHMNPITKKDIIEWTEFAWNPEYMISVSLNLHNAIHYGAEAPKPRTFVERTPFDTCPWRKVG